MMIYDNTQPNARQALIEELEIDGLPAFEYHSGGGCFHVCASLYNNAQSAGDWLALCTGEEFIGLTGDRSDNLVDHVLVMLSDTATVAETAKVFRQAWAGREEILRGYHEGEYDL